VRPTEVAQKPPSRCQSTEQIRYTKAASNDSPYGYPPARQNSKGIAIKAAAIALAMTDTIAGIRSKLRLILKALIGYVKRTCFSLTNNFNPAANDIANSKLSFQTKNGHSVKGCGSSASEE